MSLSRVALLGGASLLALAAPADAAKLTVGQGGLATIQDAVDAALLNADPADTILVPAGDYVETVVVAFGVSGQESLSIRRQGKGAVNLTGATGPALRLNGAWNVAVEDLTLTSSSALDGIPALLIDGSSRDATFRNVRGAAGDDVGVAVFGSGTVGVTMIDCDFSGMASVGFQLDGVGHRLVGCVADQCAFNAFLLTDQSLLCELINCSSDAGGLDGGSFTGTCSVLGSGHRLRKVKIRNSGLDGFYVDGQGHVLEKCSATDNLDDGFECDTAQSTFVDCSATGNGDGWAGGGLGALVRGGNFSGNADHGVRVTSGGTVLSDVSAAANGGDGVHVAAAAIGVRVTDSTFKKNGGEGVRVQGQVAWVEGNVGKGGDGFADEGTGNHGRDNKAKAGATNDF